MNQDQGQKFLSFMELNRNLLECYASNGMNPAYFKSLDAAAQKQFCLSERAQLEDALIRQKVTPADFFKAAQSM